MIEALLVSTSLVASRGEWVTREDTGERICQVSREIYKQTPLSATGWCENWTISPPVENTVIPSAERGWIRCNSGCQLHIENKGWR